MNTFDRLIQKFEKFPGIGGRQAKRFVFHLLTMEKGELNEIAELITSIQTAVQECHSCHQFFAVSNGETLCRICSNTARDPSKLVVVERDSDIAAIERSGMYDGYYFVLGGTIPLLNSDESKKLRGGALKERITSDSEHVTEIILAFSINPDGENTARYVEQLLKDTLADTAISITHMGRGLSTGSELEYADPETIKSALQNRA